MNDKLACDLCGDQVNLVLNARCHFTAPLAARIEKGVLILSCYLPDCRREVARFQILNGEILK